MVASLICNLLTAAHFTPLLSHIGSWSSVWKWKTICLVTYDSLREQKWGHSIKMQQWKARNVWYSNLLNKCLCMFGFLKQFIPARHRNNMFGICMCLCIQYNHIIQLNKLVFVICHWPEKHTSFIHPLYTSFLFLDGGVAHTYVL